MKVAGLFAGIGGLELGLEGAGHTTSLLCEFEPMTRSVLRRRFPSAQIAEDVRGLRALPRDTELVTAGFPCQDLSQAGRTDGIRGAQSGLVSHVFRLLERRRTPWVLLENVKNMLRLDGGEAMAHLVERFESLGYSWAYRVVDTRAFGLPQRRERVFFLASREGAPEDVLLAEDVAPRWEDHPFDPSVGAYGFYWTEGNRGVGWARDAIPTLKGGSTLGIPSPPAVWFPLRATAVAFATPGIEDAEALQGFRRGWTAPTTADTKHERHRWKMVGNAVSVPVARWVGQRLADPGQFDEGAAQPFPRDRPWPVAAFGKRGQRWMASVTTWPIGRAAEPLSSFIRSARPLSLRAAEGFYRRLMASGLRVAPQEFRQQLREYCRLQRLSLAEIPLSA